MSIPTRRRWGSHALWIVGADADPQLVYAITRSLWSDTGSQIVRGAGPGRQAHQARGCAEGRLAAAAPGRRALLPRARHARSTACRPWTIRRKDNDMTGVGRALARLLVAAGGGRHLAAGLRRGQVHDLLHVRLPLRHQSASEGRRHPLHRGQPRPSGQPRRDLRQGRRPASCSSIRRRSCASR